MILRNPVLHRQRLRNADAELYTMKHYKKLNYDARTYFRVFVCIYDYWRLAYCLQARKYTILKDHN